MIGLSYNQKSFNLEIDLPASKSIYNRILILNAIYQMNLRIKNPSNSGDSVLLESLLHSENEILNCENAGTVLRFLTAYFVVGKKERILTGSERMLERPIAQLVDSLTQIGADIKYTKKVGFPPIKISSSDLKGGIIQINGEVSSQFISALAMIGPKLTESLTIHIEGKISSKPYIEMTVKLMQKLGFDIDFTGNIIAVGSWNGACNLIEIEIEPDWSAVSFWFQMIANSQNASVIFKKLSSKSLQGDSILGKWAKRLGIELTNNENGILIKKSNLPIEENTSWNLADYPDLAPSLIVLLSSFKQKAYFTGLESLKIKESNRILALQTELKKCQVELKEVKEHWELDATHFKLTEGTVFENYNDHRIAMAFASLAFLAPIRMNKPESVNKSYPDFWNHLKQAGICIENDS